MMSELEFNEKYRKAQEDRDSALREATIRYASDVAKIRKEYMSAINQSFNTADIEEEYQFQLVEIERRFSGNKVDERESDLYQRYRSAMEDAHKQYKDSISDIESAGVPVDFKRVDPKQMFNYALSAHLPLSHSRKRREAEEHYRSKRLQALQEYKEGLKKINEEGKNNVLG